MGAWILLLFALLQSFAINDVALGKSAFGKFHSCARDWRTIFHIPERCQLWNVFNFKEVTLHVKNVLKEPTFDEQVTLPCTKAWYLFEMMQEAADINKVFRFTASYDYAGHPGFFVNAFNGVFSTWEEDGSWWQILDGEMKLTPVGASSYKPKDGETVMFNLTQGHH